MSECEQAKMNKCVYQGQNQSGVVCSNSPIHSEDKDRRILGYRRCDLITNCYYKQLQAAKKENEELKGLIKSVSAELNDLYKRAGVDWEAVVNPKSCSYYDGQTLIGHCQISDNAIHNLVVDKKYRRRGVASALLRMAMDNGAKYLACKKEYVAFYVNRGFKVYCVKYSEEFRANMYYMVYKTKAQQEIGAENE